MKRVGNGKKEKFLKWLVQAHQMQNYSILAEKVINILQHTTISTERPKDNSKQKENEMKKKI